MTEQLKPCPFCGSEPHDAHHIEYGRWAVTCRCGATGASANTGPNATDAAKIKAYSDARTAWNTRALTQRPAEQAGEVDDGDVTGQPGPLPETGWDVVPAGAFRKPSPTAGMNLWQRIRHVGGRENAAGYIEFGSVAAVRALVRQYLRDLPAPQQATPEPVGEPWGWAIEDKHGVAQAIRPARKEFFGCVQSTDPFTAEDIAKMDREWPGIAPHHVVTLYPRPAPGVPEGFALVQTPITAAMHQAACKVLIRSTGLDGLPQRMLDALAAAQANGGWHG